MLKCGFMWAVFDVLLFRRAGLGKAEHPPPISPQKAFILARRGENAQGILCFARWNPVKCVFEDRDTRICSIFAYKNRTAGNSQNADISRGFGHMSNSCSVSAFESRTPQPVGTQRVEPICSVCSILLSIIIEKKYIRNYIKESFDLKSEQTEQKGKSELFRLICIFGSS